MREFSCILRFTTIVNTGSQNTIAVVLAAGKGTRMKSSTPKVLHEIFNIPLLGWVLRSLGDIESVVVTGSGREQVEAYLADKNVKTAYQAEQLGTGHALSCALSQIPEDFGGNILVLCGDTPLITNETLISFIKYHNREESPLSVMTSILDNPQGYGRIVRDSFGCIKKIVEQKDCTTDEAEINEINTGVYLLNYRLIAPLLSKIKNNNNQGEYYLTDIISLAVEHKLKPCAYCIKNFEEVFGVNSKQDLAAAFKIMNSRHIEYLMTKGVTVVDPNNTYISPETDIEADTVILPSCYIENKNYIASGCKIGPMAHLRGNCKIGEGCKIGNFVELKNATVEAHTNIAHLTYVGDAEIGSNVNIGAGTIFANYNSVTKEKKKSTLANGVSIGSNSVLVAPVELGENAFVAAGTVVTKNAEKNSLVITRAPQKEIKDWIRSKK
ncbi:bifunctional N-acetylglucosamine-1-phosphate uridyltransferase/glucosamine-1-phosphate acetyltransferase [bacterium]|nr:bifunctional N-acetylglucosamine-1-phosphate uridyltransferase/glucosamine-1-phosphate acetyltransferase [bacterium]